MLKNYYEILNIKINSIDQDIIESYNFKIKQFNGLPFLTDQMKNEIKDLKIAKYILLDADRKYLYDKKFNFNNNDALIDNTKICNRLFSITN